MRIFVPDEEGEMLGDRAVVICSEVEGNAGARVTESAEEIMWNIKASGQDRAANLRGIGEAGRMV